MIQIFEAKFLGEPSGLKAVQILSSWERLRQAYEEIEEVIEEYDV